MLKSKKKIYYFILLLCFVFIKNADALTRAELPDLETYDGSLLELENLLKNEPHQVSETYVKTTTITDAFGREYIEEYYITEEEYLSSSNNVDVYLPVNATSSSDFKKFTLTHWSIEGTNTNFATMDVSWRNLPTVRSFDLIGIRWSHENLISVISREEYQNTDVGYAPYTGNSTRIKDNADGVGISMNLYNAANSYITMKILVTFSTVNNFAFHLYGSYQHANYNVSLYESQRYSSSR